MRKFERRREEACVGIDFGSRCAKIIVVTSEPGGTGLHHATTVDFPASRDGLNPKIFGKELRKFVQRADLSGARTVVSVPADQAALRWVMLPNVTGTERREAAKFKVKRHLPFPVEEAYIETTEPEMEEDGNSAALVIAVRRSVVEQRVEAVAHAGLTPIAAEVEAQGVIRVIERRLQEKSRVWRNASLTILDIGGDHTQMYVVQNQRLQFMRSVRFGAAHIVKALAEALDVSYEEADRRMEMPGSHLRPDGVMVLDSGEEACIVDLSPELDRLTRECLRLLRYFRSLHPERSYAGILDHMVLSGGLAGLRGLAEYFASILKLRVEPVRPFAGLTARIAGDDFRELAVHQEAYTVALGLALSGLDQNRLSTKEGQTEAQFLWQRRA